MLTASAGSSIGIQIKSRNRIAFKKMWSKSLCEKHAVSNVHLSSIQSKIIQLIAVEYTDILPLAILCGLTVKFSYSHTMSSGFPLIDWHREHRSDDHMPDGTVRTASDLANTQSENTTALAAIMA